MKLKTQLQQEYVLPPESGPLIGITLKDHIHAAAANAHLTLCGRKKSTYGARFLGVKGLSRVSCPECLRWIPLISNPLNKQPKPKKPYPKATVYEFPDYFDFDTTEIELTESISIRR